MKNRSIIILILFVGISKISFCQTSDNRYQELKSKIDTLKIDSANTFGELFGTQFDEIFMDYKQINTALKSKSDSMAVVIASFQENEQKAGSKANLFLYGLIGAGALFLVFLLLWILALSKSSNFAKIIKQNNLDMGKLKVEIERLNNTYNSEKEQYTYALEMLEGENKKLVAELKSMQVTLDNSNSSVKQKEEEILTLKNELSALNQKLENLQNDLNSVRNEVNQQIARNEEAALQINELKEENKVKDEKLIQVEDELNRVKQSQETIINENESLKKTNESMIQELADANQDKEKVNTELKKFIEELQTMLPLPKRS